MHGPIRSAERDGLAIRREVASKQRILADATNGEKFAIGRVEEAHLAVLAGRAAGSGQYLAVRAELDVRDQIAGRGQAARRRLALDIEQHHLAAAGGSD